MNKEVTRLLDSFGCHSFDGRSFAGAAGDLRRGKRRLILLATVLIAFSVAGPRLATAQDATWHFHTETSDFRTYHRQLKETGPDTTAITIQSVDLKNTYLHVKTPIATFESQLGAPTLGVLPAGSVVNFTLWMRVTAATGVLHPSVTLWRTEPELTRTFICGAGNVMSPSPQLTTTFTPYTLSCTTTADVTFGTSDFGTQDRLVARVLVWASTSPTKKVKAELGIEGVLNGNYDSRMSLPTITSQPSITSVTPNAGPIGTAMQIDGTNFGTSQGSSSVTLNGALLTVGAWSNSSIQATVPVGATSGPVVVTVDGQVSNAVHFEVTAATNSVSYAYDSLGRLTRVINATGDTATYAYDAVGNLLSIDRTLSGVTQISDFAPGQGYAGESVTINGAGFSATPSENVVTFNGKPTAVTSSSATTLTTSVPVGASSGPLSVTTPSGAAVSSGTFVVLGNGMDPDAPSISGFTPSGGGAETVVEITGTNFAAVAANNEVRFNATAATVTAATATSLTTSVPAAATSGPITVITPDGQASTATDFIVPPPPYTQADIEDVERIAYYETRTVDISTAGKIALLTFTGTAGDWINVVFEEVTLGFCDAEVFLRDPAGLLVYSDCAHDVLSGIRLSSTGTYSLVIAPSSGLTGSLNVTIVPDLVGSITVDGPAVRVANRVPYQNVRLRFNGVAGERVGIAASEIVPISSFVGIALDDGTFLPNADFVLRYGCTDGCFIAETLPSAGTYMVVVDPEIDDVGSMTLTIAHPPADVIAGIQPGGTPVTLTTTAPGQIAKVDFNGTAGQRVSFKVTGSVSIFTSFFLRAPDGAVLAQGQLNSGSNFIDALTLPSTGVYQIIVEPAAASVGDVTISLHDVVDLVATAMIGGPTVSLALSTPGQNARIGVDGVAGQRVAVQLSSVTISSSLVSVLNPGGGTLITPVTMTTSGRFIDWVPATSGTYTIVVDPQRDSTGNAMLTATAPLADVTGSLVPGGAPVTVSVTAPGQNAVITFTASAGQRVSLHMTSVTIASSVVTISKPDGTTLASTTIGMSGGFIDTNTLSDAGTYTIHVDPAGNSTGNMTLTLFDVPPDAAVPATVDGPSVTVTVGTPGEGILVTFAGAAGQHIAINLTSVSISSSNVSLLKPDGSTLIAPISVTTSGRFLDAVLTTTGTQTLRIDPVGSATGSMTVAVITVPADVTATIAPDGTPLTVSIPSAGQNAQVSFAGAAGQRVSLRMTGVTISSSTVRILGPDGTALATSSVSTSGGFIDTNVLSTSGTYTIVVDPNAAAAGNMTLTLFDVPADLTGAIAPDATPVTVSIGTAGQNARLAFTGSIGQRISLHLSSVTIASVTVSILGPSGVPIFGGTVTVGTGGGFIDLKTLQANGAHTISINPASANTGSLTLTLYEVPPDATGTVTVNGVDQTLSLTTPGQNGAVTFDGAIGESVTVRVTANTIGSVTVRLLRPDNTVMTSVTSSASSFNLSPQTLAITGPYRIVIDPSSINTGTITVTVTNP